MADPHPAHPHQSTHPHQSPDDEAPIVATPVEARQGRKGMRVFIILCVSLLAAVAAGFLLGLLRI